MCPEMDGVDLQSFFVFGYQGFNHNRLTWIKLEMFVLGSPNICLPDQFYCGSVCYTDDVIKNIVLGQHFSDSIYIRACIRKEKFNSQ